MKVEKRSKTAKSYRIRAITDFKKSTHQKSEKDIKDCPLYQVNAACLQAAIEHENISRFDNLQTREEIVESKESDCEIGLENADDESKACLEVDTENEVKPKIRWSKYEKKYKVSWESDPRLKGWVFPHPDDPGKVSCRYCNCVLRAHKTDLYKHSGTRKHNRNAINSSNNETEKKIVLAVSTKPSLKKKFKTEKVMGPDGSYIILQSEHGVLSPERDSASIFMDYSDGEPMEETVEPEPQMKNDSEQEISDIASRIGVVLMDDIERILRTQKNVLKFFKENGELTFSDSNLRKMARICVGHLSQKYLVESALESSRLKSPSASKEKREISSKFRAIEEKLERTVVEMKNLKMSFDGVSEVLPFTPINLGDILSSPSTSRH